MFCAFFFLFVCFVLCFCFVVESKFCRFMVSENVQHGTVLVQQPCHLAVKLHYILLYKPKLRRDILSTFSNSVG